TAAMLYALPTKGGNHLPPDVAPGEQPAWVRVALTGSAADLKKLLDSGMKPDAKTTEGTTALMLAARDPAKVKLLIERGADVNARAATGIGPLMVAALYPGNEEVVGLLLQKGAGPNPGKGVEVRNDASALFFAVMAGDVKSIDKLVEAGASLKPMKIIGRAEASPLIYAVAGPDFAVVESLINHGASSNEVDGDGISVLAWAAISNRADTVRVLLAHGAQVNHVDK